MNKAITVGMTASSTGWYALMGQQALAGVKAWAETVNRAGGLRIGDQNRLVMLKHYDDEGRAHKTRALYRKLMEEDRVDLLLGPYGSHLVSAAAEVVSGAGRVLWNHGGAALKGGYDGRVVSILSPASVYFHGILQLFKELEPRPLRLAILYSERGAFPRAVALGTERYAWGSGFPLVLIAGYRDSGPELMEMVEKASPEVLLGAGSFQEDVGLARLVLKEGLRLKALGLVAAGVREFGSLLGPRAQGVYGPSQWEPEARYEVDWGPTGGEALRILRTGALGETGYPMAQAYAMGLVVQRCLREAEDIEERGLLEVARRLDFTTFFGRFCLDLKSGTQIGHSMVTVQWREGRKIVVWPRGLGDTV